MFNERHLKCYVDSEVSRDENSNCNAMHENYVVLLLQEITYNAIVQVLDIVATLKGHQTLSKYLVAKKISIHMLNFSFIFYHENGLKKNQSSSEWP